MWIWDRCLSRSRRRYRHTLFLFVGEGGIIVGSDKCSVFHRQVADLCLSPVCDISYRRRYYSYPVIVPYTFVPVVNARRYFYGCYVGIDGYILSCSVCRDFNPVGELGVFAICRLFFIKRELGLGQGIQYLYFGYTGEKSFSPTPF